MYYRISFNTWLNGTRKAKAMQGSRYGEFHYDETAFNNEELLGGKDVSIEVEEIIEVTSEEEVDEYESLRDINTGKELKKVSSSERLQKMRRSSVASGSTLGKRKLSGQETIDLLTS